MTECKSKSLAFTASQRRQIVADFDGGRLTTDAGVLLLREVDRQIGLIDAINDCIPDPRDPRYTIHVQREMLAQRIFSIAMGFMEGAVVVYLREIFYPAGDGTQSFSPLSQ